MRSGFDLRAFSLIEHFVERALEKALRDHVKRDVFALLVHLGRQEIADSVLEFAAEPLVSLDRVIDQETQARADDERRHHQREMQGLAHDDHRIQRGMDECFNTHGSLPPTLLSPSA